MLCLPAFREYARCARFNLNECTPPFFTRIFNRLRISRSRTVSSFARRSRKDPNCSTNLKSLHTSPLFPHRGAPPFPRSVREGGDVDLTRSSTQHPHLDGNALESATPPSGHPMRHSHSQPSKSS